MVIYGTALFQRFNASPSSYILRTIFSNNTTDLKLRYDNKKRPFLPSLRSIVTQLSPTTSLLRNDEKDNEVYLIGTAHISEESAKEVKDMIQMLKPVKVFVELDYQRAEQLRNSNAQHQQTAEDALETNIRNLMFSFNGGSGSALRNNSFFSGAGAGGEDMLKSTFKGFYNLLRRYGYMPGVEMKAAMDEADKINAKIIYGDVNVNDTLRDLRKVIHPSLIMRLIQERPPPELEQMVQNAMQGGGTTNLNTNDCHDLGSTVEAIKTREYASLMTKWMNTSMPEVADVMIHKRDKTMANNLRSQCGEGTVVAVVGLAHIEGIERGWMEY